MERVIRKLTTENDMDITDVSSFETEDYVGIWDEIDDKYGLLRKSGFLLSLQYICNPENIEKLDEAVHELCNQHILNVGRREKYSIKFE